MEPYLKIIGILLGYSLSCAGFYFRGRDNMETGAKEPTKWTVPSFMAFPGVALVMACTFNGVV